MLTETTTAYTTEPAASHPLAAQLPTSARSARAARRLAERHLEQWGHPPESDLAHTVALLVGELAANAVRHARVRGRDFALRMALDRASGVLRVEVSDASPQEPPARPGRPDPEQESGRGLYLVDALATRWGTLPREPLGKTVWAELETFPAGCHL